MGKESIENIYSQQAAAIHWWLFFVTCPQQVIKFENYFIEKALTSNDKGVILI
jgi:hypothetical protein